LTVLLLVAGRWQRGRSGGPSFAEVQAMAARDAGRELQRRRLAQNAADRHEPDEA
jgi:hypothetical protein